MSDKFLNSKILLKKDLPQIKIIEPFKPDEIIECENKNDFIQIINNDIEKYNSMTTQKLNKIFSIPGYKITKIKGEISLRANHTEISEVEKLRDEIKLIKDAFNELSEQVEYIKKYIS